MTARGDITEAIEDILRRERSSSLIERPRALAPTHKPVGMSPPMA